MALGLSWPEAPRHDNGDKYSVFTSEIRKWLNGERKKKWNILGSRWLTGKYWNKLSISSPVLNMSSRSVKKKMDADFEGKQTTPVEIVP